MSATIKGWAAYEPGIDLKPFEYTPRPLGPNDVQIAIEFGGICHSDIHHISGDWGPPTLPVVPGHEIAGKITAVGKDVKKFKVGDRAGVGPLALACQKSDCRDCSAQQEQYCGGSTFLWAKYPDGELAHGGYADGIRVGAHYAQKIPDALPLDAAAPLMCAGVTVFKPLKDHKAGPGRKVAIVGIGGLGHLAVKFAAAMGADVTVFSHSPDKEADAAKLGAHHFVLSTDENLKKHAKSFDTVLMTASGKLNWPALISLPYSRGSFVVIGAPGGQMTLPMGQFLNQSALTGSLIGSPSETQEMLDFAAEHGVKPIYEVMPLSEVNKAIQKTNAGKARYRMVLDISK